MLNILDLYLRGDRLALAALEHLVEDADNDEFWEQMLAVNICTLEREPALMYLTICRRRLQCRKYELRSEQLCHFLTTFSLSCKDVTDSLLSENLSHLIATLLAAHMFCNNQGSFDLLSPILFSLDLQRNVFLSVCYYLSTIPEAASLCTAELAKAVLSISALVLIENMPTRPSLNCERDAVVAIVIRVVTAWLRANILDESSLLFPLNLEAPQMDAVTGYETMSSVTTLFDLMVTNFLSARSPRCCEVLVELIEVISSCLDDEAATQETVSPKSSSYKSAVANALRSSYQYFLSIISKTDQTSIETCVSFVKIVMASIKFIGSHLSEPEFSFLFEMITTALTHPNKTVSAIALDVFPEIFRLIPYREKKSELVLTFLMHVVSATLRHCTRPDQFSEFDIDSFLSFREQTCVDVLCLCYLQLRYRYVQVS